MSELRNSLPGGSPALPADYSDALAAIQPRLRHLASSVLYYPVTHSTNDVASMLASTGAPEGAVIIADTQTAGRGRLGRRWFSPADSGLYVSVILRPDRSSGGHERATSIVTLAAGVAVAEAIEAASRNRPVIKWPNDVQINGRKVAGILAEGIVANRAAAGGARVAQVVLGCGINVNRASYPPELEAGATSLEAEAGESVHRATVFAETMRALDARYDDLLAGRFDAILDAWRERAPARHGSRVRWETTTGPRWGITEDVDDGGALLVRTESGLERLVAGEVHWESHDPRH
jgi:BirA family biotin operon repressor/biotin-[acetyl-CoA-carboxylase] ligase